MWTGSVRHTFRRVNVEGLWSISVRMLASIAGPFGRNFSQGDVGGALGELGYDRESVWKL